MKFVRFQSSGHKQIQAGVLTDKGIEVIEGDIFGEWSYTGETVNANAVELRTPFEPNEVIGIGKNFIAAESERIPAPSMPILFFKPKTTVVGPNDPIVLPQGIEQVKFESELAVVIGKEARNISEAEVKDAIFGYTITNDLCAAEYFHEEGHWTIGKSFDSFCPVGPVLETDFDADNAVIEAYVNDKQLQNSPVSLMITSIPQMISYISSFMTLKPGDVILTGTPVGADMVGAGDVIDCKIEGLGTLRNQVIKS